jgi:hypothetical protein
VESSPEQAKVSAEQEDSSAEQLKSRVLQHKLLEINNQSSDYTL